MSFILFTSLFSLPYINVQPLASYVFQMFKCWGGGFPSYKWRNLIFDHASFWLSCVDSEGKFRTGKNECFYCFIFRILFSLCKNPLDNSSLCNLFLCVQVSMSSLFSLFCRQYRMRNLSSRLEKTQQNHPTPKQMAVLWVQTCWKLNALKEQKVSICLSVHNYIVDQTLPLSVMISYD